jgi:hypothetical protein
MLGEGEISPHFYYGIVMTKLKNLDARLFRNIPDSHRHMTVYGNQEFTTFTCVVCKEKGYLSEAYLKSKSARKHGSDIRPYHASCYNETNGKVRKKEKSTASLFDFIME